MSDEEKEAPAWAVIVNGGTRMHAEQVRCLLAGCGIHALALDEQVPAARYDFFGVASGARVIVPKDQYDEAETVLRDAGFVADGVSFPISGLTGVLFSDAGKKDEGGGRKCNFCDAPAEDDSVYCDQCGQALDAR